MYTRFFLFFSAITNLYPHRVKANAKEKAKAMSLGRTTLICTGVFTRSESERDITFLIACGSIGAKSLSLSLGVGIP